ncbi:hypothetical protein A7982_14005 [Minicystis rosea]|nr:hypothetical protein A7982_14005 [Minicystis rosea]
MVPHVAFALERGVSISTFRQWLYKLRTELPPQAPSRPALRLLPVTVAGASSSSELLEVSVNGLVLRFRAGTDPRCVARLVVALHERG